MIGLRDIRFRRLGAALAGVGMYLQLAIAGLAMPVFAADSTPADALGEHALCLADAAVQHPGAPAEKGPAAPPHDHTAFCCLWHSPLGIAPQAALAPQPVAYVSAGHGESGATGIIPAPRRSPVNARAPPPRLS